MSFDETNEIDTAAARSPLSFWQQFLVGVAIWPAVIFIGLMLPSVFSGSEDVPNYVLVLAFVVSVTAGKYLWRFFIKSPFRAGTVFGASSIFMLVCVALLAVGFASDDEIMARLSDHSESAKLLSGDEAAPEEARQLSGSVSALGLSTHRSAFETCIDELHRKSATGSMRSEALRILSKIAGPELAEDATQDVIISVCTKYERSKVRALRPYFFKSIHNTYSDLETATKSRWEYCEFDETQFPRCGQDYENAEMLNVVQAAMCRIDSRQAYVLRERADNARFKEIAAELGVSVANSRQLYVRGREALHDEVERLSGCRLFEKDRPLLK